MYTFTADTSNINRIGYAGENETRQIVFEYPADWLNVFPEGEIELHVKRAGDAAVYKARQTLTDDTDHTLTWTVTSADTSYSGSGEVQLCCIENGRIVKSQKYQTHVAPSTAAVTPVAPPPETIIEQAVIDYITQHVDVVVVRDTGEAGQVLQSNGDGTYSWQTVSDPVVDNNGGVCIVPAAVLARLARAIRDKTNYEGELNIETMADVLDNTDMWTTEEYALGLAPAAAEITLSVGTLPAYAFYGRSHIAKVNLPYCGRINDNAFVNSTVSIIDAPNVVYITKSVFNTATSLTSVNMPKLQTISDVSNFYGCTCLSEVSFPELKYIAGTTFQNCICLNSVYLPEVVNVTGLNATTDSVFNGCRSLERIELPKFEGKIRTTWFDACYNLREIILPHLKGIQGTNNFRNCYALEKLYAPECDYWASTNFSGCSSLKKLCLYKKPSTLGATAFNAPNLEHIYVPWAQGEVAGAPWGAPAGCTVHYNTRYDENGEPILS